ncbi:MAG: hypothetical protein Q9215_006108 [Flavoplaca cf. flavocitrina]
MHGYTQRNIRAWHRRFSKLGWVIRVLDRQPASPLNIANYLPLNDPDIFPKAFRDGTIGGDYAPQHTSDLVRWPLLLSYGGVYADVGLMHIGDLDRLWNETVGDADSGFEVLSYDTGGLAQRSLTNYFLASRRRNPLFSRCHKLLLKLWGEDGGKVGTEGMHESELLKGVPLMQGDFTIEEGDRVIGAEEVRKMLTDYIIQGQVMTMAMGLVDEEDDGWDGPKYVEERVYAIEFMVGAQLVNELTNWDGRLAFHLLSLPLPGDGKMESEEQVQARGIVEGCLQRSFRFKLAHGMILRVFGETLGSLWRKNEGVNCVPGTCVSWLRYGMIYWSQTGVPRRVVYGAVEPIKRGSLLKGD